VNQVVDEGVDELVALAAGCSGRISEHAARADRLHPDALEFFDVRIDARFGQFESDETGVDSEHQGRFDTARVEVLGATVGALRPLRRPRQHMATLVAKCAHGSGERARISAVAIDENDTSGPISAPPEFENHVMHHRSPDRERSRKAGVFARCGDGQRGADHEAVGEMHRTRDDLLGDQRVG